MADARRVSTRRAVLSYSQLKNLSNFPDLLLKDYQGILQDFVFTADEIDKLEQIVIEEQDQIDAIKDDIIVIKADIEDLEEGLINLQEDVLENTVDIIDLQDSHYPSLFSQMQFLQKQLNGLPEFTIDTSGFTTDLTFITTDKVIA